MDFPTWEPVYEAVLADFGYDRAGDERARDLLASEVESASVDPYELEGDAFAGDTVAVAAPGPSLPESLDRVRAADVVIAASTAADTLRERGIELDLVVTDLDKHPGTVRELTAGGVPVAVHAHGDNVPALREYVPTFALENVLPTTQAEPSGPVANYGGFTDGDRAAFLADHVGAGRLVFPGWDFDDGSVGPEKRHKLEWAKRLLYWLEQRRGERFDVLEGYRDGIDTAGIPHSRL